MNKTIQPVYECVLLIRPNLSENQAKMVAKELYPIIQDNGGTIHHAEYWGFKTLAYKLKKNTKAHYVLINFELSSLNTVHSFLQFNQSILRFLCIKCDAPITSPSPQFVSYLDDTKNNETDDNDDKRNNKMSSEMSYKNIRFIKKYVTEHGKIVPAYMSRTSRLQQKKIAIAVKRARFIDLLPYVVK